MKLSKPRRYQMTTVMVKKWVDCRATNLFDAENEAWRRFHRDYVDDEIMLAEVDEDGNRKLVARRPTHDYSFVSWDYDVAQQTLDIFGL